MQYYHLLVTIYPTIHFNDEVLNRVENCMYLGLSLDSNLKWDSHIQRICQNVSYKLMLLNRLKKFLSSEVLRKIYVTNIQPCIEYGISIWGHCSEHNKSMIQRLQHRAARIILSNFGCCKGHLLLKDTCDFHENAFINDNIQLTWSAVITAPIWKWIMISNYRIDTYLYDIHRKSSRGASALGTKSR